MDADMKGSEMLHPGTEAECLDSVGPQDHSQHCRNGDIQETHA